MHIYIMHIEYIISIYMCIYIYIYIYEANTAGVDEPLDPEGDPEPEASLVDPK